jgi:hypothetical protein
MSVHAYGGLLRRHNRLLSLLAAALVWVAPPTVGICTAQAIYLPSQHEVYDFLQRMESRGLLEEYRDAVRPLARRTIAAHLKRLEVAVDAMT